MSLKYGIIFVLMALAAATTGCLAADALAEIGMYLTAGSFLIVAIAYLRGWTWLLMKRTDGTRPWWAWVPLWPYFGLVWVSFWFVRVLYRRGASTEVAPGVWLSRRLNTREFRASGVPWIAVLDLTAELPRGAPAKQAYPSLPVLDGTAPSVEQLDRAIQWIDGHRASGPVLVHCAARHGRSAAIILAWLLSCGQVADLKSGLERLQKLRRGVALNARQLARLREFTE